MDKQRTASGRIIAVQEERFRLMTDSGDTLLLTLSRFSSVSPRELKAWHKSDAHVSVTYDGRPNLASGVARSLTRLPNGKNGH